VILANWSGVNAGERFDLRISKESIFGKAARPTLITGSRSKIPNPLPCVANGKTRALNAGHPGVGGNDRATRRRAQWHYLERLDYLEWH
jgi:hypothetical protein